MTWRSEFLPLIKSIIVAAIIAAPVFYHAYVNVTRPPYPIFPPPYAWVALGDPAEFKIGNLLFKVPRPFITRNDQPMRADGFDNGMPVFQWIRILAWRLPDGQLIPPGESPQDRPAEGDPFLWLINATSRTETELRLSPTFLAHHADHGAASRTRPGLTQYFGRQGPHPYYGIVKTSRGTIEVMINCLDFIEFGCTTFVDYSVPVYLRVVFRYADLDHWEEIIRAVFDFMDTFSAETRKN